MSSKAIDTDSKYIKDIYMHLSWSLGNVVDMVIYFC